MMAKIPVYSFEVWDIKQDKYVRAKRPATLDAIKECNGRPILETAQEVEPSRLDANGFVSGMKFAELTLAQGQEAIVVVFDICSSSTIVEELTIGNALHRYVWLVGKMKNFLAKLQMRHSPPRFGFYKFTGDGWILLFPVERDAQRQAIGGDYVLGVIRELSLWFERTFETWAIRYLDTRPPVVGLTFGVDRGNLVRTTIFQKEEYLAHAIIMATRLQSELSSEASPGYKALTRNSVFQEHFTPAADYTVADVSKTFKNIGEGNAYSCKRISLLPRGDDSAAERGRSAP